VGVLGLGLLVLGFTRSSAQPPMGGFGGGFGFTQTGRFTVAHAMPSQVLILDTATGQVYQAKSGDFKKMSELPRVGGGFMGGPPFFDKEKEKDKGFRPPFGREKDKDFRRPFEKEKDIKEKDEKDKDAKEKDEKEKS